MSPLRFLLSAVIACGVVFVLMVSVLWGFGLLDRPERTIDAHPVELLSTTDRVDVARLLGQGDGRRLPEPPPPRDIPPMEIPERMVTGFVQLEVQTDEHGAVQRAAVVNALPGGVYEEQALRQVRQRRYPPREGGGTYLEVVPFRVSAGELPARADSDQPAGTEGLSE